MSIPGLVAHRGYPQHYPENTLPGLRAAIACGACHVEFDVQLSADGVPMVIHDADLRRTGGVAGQVMTMTAARLQAQCVDEPQRLAARCPEATIPTLDAALALFDEATRVTAFVEIKQESIDAFGREATLDAVLAVLARHAAHSVPISYDHAGMAYARAHGAQRIGWVVSCWDAAHERCARSLQADYLFCNHTRMPDDPQAWWRGDWAWALYEVTDPALALALGERGADLIETFAIAEMLDDPRLRQRRCLER
jgi:glycerophosphoryl diester phosphodiesterase